MSDILAAGARAGAGARRGPRPGAGAASAAAARRPARRAAGAGARGADGVVRARRRGRGHHQPQDRRLPGGLPLLLAVRAVRLARAQRVAGHPEPGARPPSRPPRPARPSSASSPPCADPTSGCWRRSRAGIEAIRDEVDIQIACSLGMLTQEQVERARRDGRAPLQPQPGDRAVVLHQRRHHPHLGGALGHAADGPRGRHGGVLRRHPRHGRNPRAARRVRGATRRAATRTRCR